MTPKEYAFDQALFHLRGGRREQAMELLAEVTRLDIKHADAWSLRGRLEGESGRPFNALLHHEKAVQAAPERADLWCNLGIDAASAKRMEASEKAFQTSLELEDTFEGHYNYANLLSTLMRVDECVEHYKAATKMNASHAQTHANLGITLMAQGKWREGFTEYRHRFNAAGFPPRPRLNYPIWHGEPLGGKTVLLYVEQGFGDEIMGLRFAKTVKELGARVVLAVRPVMFRLARTFEHADAVILQYDESPWPIDYMCALLDVPSRVDIWPDTVPLKGKYLRADDRGFSLTWPEGLRVGICWASGKRPLQPEVFETAKQKSLPFEAFAPLARDGVVLVCLQQHHNSHDALKAAGVIDPMVTVQDFADTAWIIDQLDLVVTVDTAVAHLAGAMGKPVWNLVRFDGMWPWTQETRWTCWYDSMTLYRQTKLFDWSEPLGRLMADFAKFVSLKAAA